MVTKYGMISDIHEDPRIIVPTLEALQMEGVDKLIINGDIGGNYGSLEKSQKYTAFILDNIAKSGLEAFVQPGSHETLLGYGPVIEHFSDKHSNIVDTLKNPKVEFGDHDLVFLPGSDFLCGGEYQIGSNEQLSSGRYIQSEKGLIKFEEFGQYVDALNSRVAKGAFQYSNMGDLRDLVTDPDKGIVVCHVPRKFDDIENGVDVAEFGDVVESFNTQQGLVEKGTVIPLQFVQPYLDAGAPVVVKKENRGNEDLKNLYEEIGVRKAVSAHFHESSHRAHDSKGNPVRENTAVDDLFWNSGHLDRGYFGILSVDGERVSYRNLNLKDFS
jgi:Icc-related predicted phosphoesterase